MKFLCLIALIAACHAAPAGKIVGGSNSSPNKWPWQLSLQYTSSTGGSFSHICGASLISANYALTAAHCVSHDPVESKFRVVAGEHQLTTSSTYEQNIYIEKIIQHPDYSDNANGFPHDIALLKLSSPATLNDQVKVAALPSSTSTSYYDGRECYITGWGRLTGGGSLPNTLQEAKTSVISHSNCRSALGLTGLLYLQQGPHICVYTGDNGACNGDSGGPLVCDVGGTWELAGATSWGLQNCPTSSPSVYTRISNYLSWISSNLDM